MADLLLAVLAAFGVSAWWYLWNFWSTGNWSGLYFSARLQDWSLKQAALRVDWPNAVKTILSSHVWFGNWSFLKIRGWMYQLAIIAFLIGVVGTLARLARDFRRSAPDRYSFLVTVLFYAFFWLGLGYYVMLTYVATSVSATGGWYLTIAVTCELLVLFAGLALLSKPAAMRVAAAAALGVTLIDAYGVFFLLIPYYTGFIAHNTGGSLPSFKPWMLTPADYIEILGRLTVNKPGVMTRGYFLMSSLFFLLAGVGSVAVAVRFLWRPGRTGTNVGTNGDSRLLAHGAFKAKTIYSQT